MIALEILFWFSLYCIVAGGAARLAAWIQGELPTAGYSVWGMLWPAWLLIGTIGGVFCVVGGTLFFSWIQILSGHRGKTAIVKLWEDEIVARIEKGRRNRIGLRERQLMRQEKLADVRMLEAHNGISPFSPRCEYYEGGCQCYHCSEADCNLHRRALQLSAWS